MKPVPFLLCGFLLLFVALKLTNYLDWSWWWVLSPLWVCPALILATVLFFFVLCYTVKAFRWVFPKRRRGNAPLP